MKIFRLALLSIITALVLITASAQQSISQGIPSHIETVYTQTSSNTNIPLRVPSIIPLNSPAAPSNYWASNISRDNFYSISFNRAADCSGVEECSFASVSGEINAEASRNYQQQLIRPRVEQITLNDGTPAIFSPHYEGIYGPSSVFVKTDGYLYTFNIYMADKTDVVAMANSALSVFSQ